MLTTGVGGAHHPTINPVANSTLRASEVLTYVQEYKKIMKRCGDVKDQANATSRQVASKAN